ncbi:hypothetical protein, partial [Streptomyces sp.]|uniref:hypothetical protein n=1 Tax=Streptomyces sp. TaxID=1931 RepID=UPI00281135D5
MSAATEPTQQHGKSTHGSSTLSVGDATRMLSLPHLPYADAVLAELDTEGMPPAALEAGLRRGRTGAPELFIRCVWPVGSPWLGDGARWTGLSLTWSHVTGWSAHNADDQAELLDVDVLAAPDLVADIAMHYAEHGVGCAW